MKRFEGFLRVFKGILRGFSVQKGFWSGLSVVSRNFWRSWDDFEWVLGILNKFWGSFETF